MKDTNCNFCNPKKFDWVEKGFYGYQCFECTSGRSAFIILDDHRGFLTDEEKKDLPSLIEKHYPGLELKGIPDKRKSMIHWYDMLIKNNVGS